MNAIRRWIFKRLSAIGWAICPEPHKSRMQKAMPSWDDLVERMAKAMWADMPLIGRLRIDDLRSAARAALSAIRDAGCIIVSRDTATAG